MSAYRPSLFAAHPWHGVHPGENAPVELTAYVEMVPTDVVKYELDKDSGLLKADRPIKFSSVPPSLYGFIPRTLCDAKVGERCGRRLGREGVQGDQDPMDICILTERPFAHGNVLVPVMPVGGLRMVDRNEADDKIIAVLKGDAVWAGIDDIARLPEALIERLKHYFLTYKLTPGESEKVAQVEIAEVYGREEAYETIRASFDDYRKKYLV
jgi:inorganic pyrophosphatase